MLRLVVPKLVASCKSNQRLGLGVLYGVRNYSDKKYRNIDEFNKFKTEYSFGEIDELEPGSSTKDIHAKIAERMHNEEQQNVNDLIEQDERLKNLEYGSPEYKDMLFTVSEEFKANHRKNQERYETRERLKAVGFGIVFIVGVISAHQFMFHYQWYKSYFNKSSYDINEGVIDKKKKKNTKNLAYLLEKLNDILDKDFVDSVVSSDNVGLYVSGVHGKKLPVRIPFFDKMFLQDVKSSGDLLVVVAQNGKAYQLRKGEKTPQSISLPSKVSKCEISRDFVYFLTNNGQVIYSKRPDSKIEFEGQTTRNWILLKSQSNVDYLTPSLNRGEKIKDISSGESHLLLLSNKGRLFSVKSGSGENCGQYGLPTLAPINKPNIDMNEVFELTLLNNELIVNDNNKTIRPRVFTAIASGRNHNLVADSNGNIWTWGSNTLGQCGIDVNYKSDCQPVPEQIISLKQLEIITRCKLAGIDSLYANEETSFIKVQAEDGSDVLLSFGNGIKGQLGINRFLHLSHVPVVVKTLKLEEFNEASNKVESIGIKNISTGHNHTVVQLDNSGGEKDVLIFGDNEFGQFGNGKLVRSPKPVPVPNLIEPEDIKNIEQDRKSTLKTLAKRVNDPDNRLSLKQQVNGKKVEQVVQATGNTSVIYYKCK